MVKKWLEFLSVFINPVRNSSGALNLAGIILKSNPAAEQRGIISNGVNLSINFLHRNGRDSQCSRRAIIADPFDPRKTILYRIE